jgi:hypothetical protein
MADTLVELLKAKLASRQAKARILSTSYDEALRRTRQLLLKAQGYEVISTDRLESTLEHKLCRPRPALGRGSPHWIILYLGCHTHFPIHACILSHAATTVVGLNNSVAEQNLRKVQEDSLRSWREKNAFRYTSGHLAFQYSRKYMASGARGF